MGNWRTGLPAGCPHPQWSLSGVGRPVIHGGRGRAMRSNCNDPQTLGWGDFLDALCEATWAFNLGCSQQPANTWVFRTNVTADSGIVTDVPANVTGAIAAS